MTEQSPIPPHWIESNGVHMLIMKGKVRAQVRKSQEHPELWESLGDLYTSPGAAKEHVQEYCEQMDALIGQLKEYLR